MNIESPKSQSIAQNTQKTSVRLSMDQCIKCNICQSHCPVAAVTGAFPGPKYAGPQAERFRVVGDGIEISPMLCNGCGVCSSVCPNDVAVSDIITLAKAEVSEGGQNLSLGQRLLNRPDLIGKLASPLPWLSNILLGNGALRTLVEKTFGIDRNAPLPKIKGREFARWFAQHKQPEGPEVAYFQGCSTGYFDPKVGMDLVRLLNTLGLRVKVPTDLCCSLPMLSSGEVEAAKPRARALIDDLRPTVLARVAIVATSTSCSMTLRSKYQTYLGMEDDDAKAVGRSVVDICEYLRDNLQGQLSAKLNPLPIKVLYHGPCQLRSHRTGLPAVTLLRLIPGMDLELSSADCCGIGGTYGYDVKKREISNAIGATLVSQALRSKPDLIVCDSETCRWNIEAQTGVTTIHPVQLLLHAILGKATP